MCLKVNHEHCKTQLPLPAKQNGFTKVHIIVFHNKVVLLPSYCVAVVSSYCVCIKKNALKLSAFSNTYCFIVF